MAGKLSADLVTRIKARAADPARRSDQSSLEAQSVGMDEMLAGMPKSDDPAVREYLEGMNTPFAGMISNLVTGDGSQSKGLFGMLGGLMGGQMMMTSSFDRKPMVVGGSGADPEPAAPPASEAEVAGAEATLGFALPSDLRQFYLEIANGGVGPGNGIYSLTELIAKRREMTKDAVGPQGQEWPANLLPIQGEDWDIIAIDRDSGRLIYWDLEDIDDVSDDPDDPTWAKSFVPESHSLEAWLAKWLDRPSTAEQIKAETDKAMSRKPYTEDELEQMEPEIDEWIRRSKIYDMTPEERAAMGLPEHGWEEKIWEGFDPEKSLKKPR